MARDSIWFFVGKSSYINGGELTKQITIFTDTNGMINHGMI